MRRHRPLDSYYAARGDENLGEEPERSVLRTNDGRGYIRDTVYSTRNGVPAQRLGESHTLSSRTSSRDGTRLSINASGLNYSPIPFYTEHSSSLLAQPADAAPVTSTAATATNAPRAFYDAPSMRDSIPALLQQLSKKSVSNSLARGTENTITVAQLQRSAANDVLSSRFTRRKDAAPEGQPVTVPQDLNRKSVFATPAAAGNAGLSPFYVVQRAVTPSTDSLAKKPKHSGQLPNSKAAGVSSAKAADELQSQSQSQQEQQHNEHSGMRYVVVQQPAAVHSTAYVPPTPSSLTSSASSSSRSSTPPTPDSTARLPAAPRKAKDELLDVSPQHHGEAFATAVTEGGATQGEAAGSPVSTLPRESSTATTRSRQSMSRLSSASRSSVPADRAAKTATHSKAQSVRGHSSSGAAPKTSTASPSHKQGTLGAAAPSVNDRNRLRITDAADQALLMKEQKQQRTAGATTTADANHHDRLLRSASADTQSGRETGTSSTHVSSTRMRNLFASLLDKTRSLGSRSGTTQTTIATSTAASARTDSPADTHASSTLTSASRDSSMLRGTVKRITKAATTSVPRVRGSHQHQHTRTIASPLARDSQTYGVVESEGVSAALLRGSSSRLENAFEGMAQDDMNLLPVADAPFANAVLEGGDPLVLRHTIDYLLSKARRLERENATLWSQTHSWNPHRCITPVETATETRATSHSPLPVRAARKATTSSTTTPLQPPSRRSISTGTPPRTRRDASVGAVDASAATQTERDGSGQQPRIFVQRQRCSAAAGRSPSPPSATSTPSEHQRPYHSPRRGERSADHRGTSNLAAQDGGQTPAENGILTPPAVHHSITVSSPSAAVDTTSATTTATTSAATHNRSDASVQQQQSGLVEASAADTSIPQSYAPREHRAAQTVQRAEAAVQHQGATHQATTTPNVSFGESPTLSKSSQVADLEETALSSPTAAAAVASHAPAKSLTSSTLRTPPQRSVHLHEPTVAVAVAAAPAGQEDVFTTTPLASTVRSHRSVESRRSVGSMTSHVTPLHASALQAQQHHHHNSDNNNNNNNNDLSGVSSQSPQHKDSSSVRHSRQRQRTTTNDRDSHGGVAFTPTAGAATPMANISTSNASFGSLGRPPTYNKQVQTASILSPAAEDEGNGSDGETVLDSNLDGTAGTSNSMSAERTSIIELHTSAAYNRTTVQRLRAYCASLETTRQQLRRRVGTSPTSRSASLAASAMAGVASHGGSRVFGTSSRSPSHSTFPLPLAQPRAAFEGTGASTRTATASAPSVLGGTGPLSPSMLSRPFFQSEYADPEVDATLHDFEETPATETMIVLHEDGSGSVTKRVVDGSPTRASASAGRSTSATSQQDAPPQYQHSHQHSRRGSLSQLAPQHHRHYQQSNGMASSFVSYNGFEGDEAAFAVSSATSRVSPRAHRPPFSLTRAGTTGTTTAITAGAAAAGVGGGRLGSSIHRAHDSGYSPFNTSLQSDGAVREVAPNVHLGRSLRSDSATSWPASSEQREARSPDIAPLAQSSIVSAGSESMVGHNGGAGSMRFAVPSPTASLPREEQRSRSHKQHTSPSAHARPPQTALPSPQPQSAPHATTRATMVTATTTATELAASTALAAVNGRAYSTSSSSSSGDNVSRRFAVPDVNASTAAVREVRSTRSSRSRSRSSNNSRDSESGTQRRQMSPEPARRAAAQATVPTPPPPQPAPASTAAAMWNPKMTALISPPVPTSPVQSSPKTAGTATGGNPAKEVLSRLAPPPLAPPPVSSSSVTNVTVTTHPTTASASAASSQIIPDHEVDSKTPRELAATTTAATAAATIATPQSHTRLSPTKPEESEEAVTVVVVGNALGSSSSSSTHRDNSHHSDPGSPAPHKPTSGSKLHDKKPTAPINGGGSGGATRIEKRSTTAEFVDDAEGNGSSPRELIRTREVVWSPIALTQQGVYDGRDETGLNEADSFSGSDIEEADELLIPEPIPIERGDSVDSNADRGHELQTADDAFPRLISPSPPPEANSPLAKVRVVVKNAKSETRVLHAQTDSAEGEDALNVSETSSRCRRRTMPPMHRPPIAPSHNEKSFTTQERSPSTSLSRSLHSFTSSSSEDIAGEDEGPDEVVESAWF